MQLAFFPYILFVIGYLKRIYFVFSTDPVEREGLRAAWLAEQKKSFAEAWLKYKDDVLISSHNAATSQEEEDEGLFETDG